MEDYATKYIRRVCRPWQTLVERFYTECKRKIKEKGIFATIIKYRVMLGDYDSFVVSVARPSFARVQK
jgi:hypothetical protein